MKKSRAAGGGRKPLTSTEPTVKVAITLLASQAEAMKQLGDGNLSAGIRKAIQNMSTTVLLKHRTSGDVFAVRLDGNGAIIKSIGPLHYTDYDAALAGDADANMNPEDNEWLKENDFEIWKS